MKISDLIGMCIDNLRKRKARSILTIIGVVVGTCSIVVMISFGVAIDIQQEEMMQSMGDLTVIQVYNWGSSGSSSVEALDDKQVKTIQSMEFVQAATPVYSSRYLQATIFAGRNDRYSMGAYNIVGMYPEAIEALGYTLMDGTYLTSGGGDTTKTIPVLVGQNAAYAFQDTRRSGHNNMIWPEPDVNGNIPDPFFDINKETLTLKTDLMDGSNKQIEIKLQVVGVMQEDFAKGYYTSQGMIMDINLLKKLEENYMKLHGIKPSNETNGYDSVTVKVDHVDNVSSVEELIKEMAPSPPKII